MPTVSLFQVDAFTDRPFAGNPAAVCLLETPLPDERLLEIAAENNLSETAFVDVGRGAGEDVLGLRWFTPTVEVELCGHATLASGFVVLNELAPSRPRVRFQTRSGILTVERAAGDELVLDLPISRPQPVDPAIAARVADAARLELREVALGKAGYLGRVDGAATVRAAAPDLVAVAALGTSLCLTAPGNGEARPVDFVSRFFAPAHGVPEDPVTGSAHCMLTPYWAARLGKDKLRARQVSRRGGELTCAIDGDRVRLGGQGRLVLRGTLMF
ncbi:MAG TPA: PhzF family phenazine biosynthesis protein [Polyangia bacterium]|nr:PhzF family phenazine biosynthesis protein [Polyangia bacterium]